ncbi:heparinase II/III family protein [Flavobacteriaceae bacterium]|nr:heparinase II/III family protein [Flavobacteriaceae bacterium]
MDFSRIKLLVNTVKYLKFEQIAYRVLYTLQRNFVKKKYSYEIKKSIEPLKWSTTIEKQVSYLENLEFRFLNITHKFEDNIDWNYNKYGKLWTYNLNYFDFLNQSTIDKHKALLLIKDYVNKTDELKDGLEPYPISLRGINWVKYLSKENIQDEEINTSLYNQYLRLFDNLEFHILGNHLLENGFSLLFGAYYFRNNIFYSKAIKILEKELKEQILKDGAHFELSPMYHMIILERLLDCIYLIESNSWKEKIEFNNFLRTSAEKMLSWLNEVKFRNGTIPMVNDSTNIGNNISNSLIQLAFSYGICPRKLKLSASGYRKYLSEKYEFFVDIGEIGPSYQPGHAHADTFSFILHYNEKEIIVDPGISTYNIGFRRDLERSTEFHNTVIVNSINSSNVWHGFRVANRAKVKILEESLNGLVAEHDGYKNIHTIHKRTLATKQNEIIIYDDINSDLPCQANLHFHPNCKISFNKIKNQLIINNNLIITFFGSQIIKLADYEYSLGFNNLILGKKITINFKKHLCTKFYFE